MSATRRGLALAALVAVVGATMLLLRRRDTSGEMPPTTTPVAEGTTAVPVARTRVAASEPEPAPAPAGAIRVAVTSLDGKPVAGARVELVRGPTEDWTWPFTVPSVAALPTEHTSATGDDGAAVLGSVAEGRWFVIATAPGFGRHVLAGVERRDGDTAADAAVALDRGHTFVGTVHDPDGAPAAGIAVVLQAIPPTVAWASDVACLRTRTGGDGAYRLDNVEPGAYRVWTEVRRGLLVEQERVLVPSLDGLDVRIARGAAVEGTVRDAGTGDVIAGARVFAVDYEPRRTDHSADHATVLDAGMTDRTGRFDLQTWRRACTLNRFVVDADGYVPAPVEEPEEVLPGTLHEGQRASIDVRLRRGVALSGTLAGPDGPLEDLRVHAIYAMPRLWPPRAGGTLDLVWRAMSDATSSDGRFRLDRLPPGQVRLAVLDARTGVCFQQEEFDVPDEREVARDIDVALKRARLSRRVVDAGGDPVEDVEVSQRLGTFHSRAVSGADGRFTLDLLVPFHPSSGGARLLLRRRGWRTAEAFPDASGEDGSNLEVWDGFQPVSDVVGAIVRPDGSPVAGTRVLLNGGFEDVISLTQHWLGAREAVTGADGGFRVPITTGPDHWLRIPSSGRPAGYCEREDGPQPLRLTLEPPVHVAGVVAAAEGGKPVRGALLRCGEDLVAARTGADGRFVADVPAAVAHGFRVTADGFVPALVAPGVADQRIELHPTLAVSGVVQLADRTPVPGLMVTVRRLDPKPEVTDEDDDASRPPDPTSATDAAGRFVVSGLGPGTYDVAVDDPARFVHTTAHVAASAGSTNLALVVGPGVRLDVGLKLIDGRGPSRPSRVTATPVDPALPTEDVRTDYYGLVSLALRPDVEYTIRAEHEGFAPAERTGVRGGGTTALVIELRAPPTPR